MNWRANIPKPFRLAYRILTRMAMDRLGGMNRQLARKKISQISHFEHVINIVQPIMPSAFFENKIHNMHLANGKINQVLILPGEVFSFWTTVGYPGRIQGFRKGRNLVEGKVQGSYGGGLCQVSSILYYMALSTDLEILERYNHSVDIYAENERFTPLGSDATVVYGYKDLRIRNTTSHPITFCLEVNEHHLTAKLLSTERMTTHTPEFIRHDMERHRHVKTMVNGKIVASSVYTLKA
jgi:vancomycin resistance protein VanW